MESDRNALHSLLGILRSRELIKTVKSTDIESGFEYSRLEEQKHHIAFLTRIRQYIRAWFYDDFPKGLRYFTQTTSPQFSGKLVADSRICTESADKCRSS